MPVPSVSFYVHIPFCHKKCSYCDFYSITGGKDLYRSVLREICRQIEAYCRVSPFPVMETLFIGGGTPSSLPPAILNRFLSDLRTILPEYTGEVTMEVNPEDVTVELLDVLDKNGVNRISMGVQSVNSTMLKTLGRNTTRIKTETALSCLHHYWPGKKSVDIITGIPGQTIHEALDDIRRITSYDPDHVSLYSLTIEEGTPLSRKIIGGNLESLPEEAENSMYEVSVRLLESLGYHRYEVSNFSKEGSESAHNRRYWEMKPYFGAGPAGVSTIPGVSGPVRIENPRNIERFLAGTEKDWGRSYEQLDPPSFFIEHLMMGFRLTEGINRHRLEEIFSVDFNVLFPRTLRAWEPFLENKGSFLALKGKGLHLLDSFLSDLVGELHPSDVQECFWP